jgi:hypothetical protein
MACYRYVGEVPMRIKLEFPMNAGDDDPTILGVVKDPDDGEIVEVFLPD